MNGHAEKPGMNGHAEKPGMNGHAEKPEEENKAKVMVKPGPQTAAQQKQKAKGYHPLHMNALHYMGKVASECLRLFLLLLQAVQVLTWKLQATGLLRSTSTASSIWVPTPWVPLQTPMVLPQLSQLRIDDGALALVNSWSGPEYWNKRHVAMKKKEGGNLLDLDLDLGHAIPGVLVGYTVELSAHLCDDLVCVPFCVMFL